jgi:hypothetical protein
MTAMKKKKVNKKFVQLKERLYRRAVLLFVPHRMNHYRPHAIRRYGLVVVTVLIIGMQLGYNMTANGQVLGVREAISSQDLLAATNAQRAERHLSALQLSPQLSQAAFLKAQNILQEQYWAHTSPSGLTPWHWFGAVGYNYAHAGENLAKNFTTTPAVMTAWMASPEHRANILAADFSQVGFATVDGTMGGQPVSLVVALYGTPAVADVAGVQATASTTPVQGTMTPVTRLGVALQSITPAALGSFALILAVMGVALAAHHYRKKLPAALRRSWYQHHGLIKAGGMLSLGVVMLFMYSGGQI